MSKIHIDIETFSEADLLKVGVHKYAEHPSTEILCISYAIDDGPVKNWRRTHGYIPSELVEAFEKPQYNLMAFNAQFERTLLNSHAGRQIGVPHTQVNRWTCVAVQAALHSLPRALGNCAIALGLVERKDETGKRVMLKLSKPRNPSKNNPATRWTEADVPGEFQTLYDYCDNDVVVERALANALPNLPKRELKYYHLDQRINDRGVRVDVKSARKIVDLWAEHVEQVKADAVDFCGYSPTQIKDYLVVLTDHGYPYADMTAGNIKAALKDATGVLRQLLSWRQEVSFTSAQKYKTMLRVACEDNRVRGMFLFWGAGTGRWTGKLVQLQNLPRNCAKHPAALIRTLDEENITGDKVQSLIRPMFTGKLLAGDWSGIELRLILWFAGETEALDKIRAGTDMYVDLATKIYRKHPDDIEFIERFLGKQATLGLGFAMGRDRFHDTCLKYDIDPGREMCDKAVDIYRETYPKVLKSWTRTMVAACKAIENPGHSFKVGPVKYVMHGKFLYCVLPSGRPISYPFPEVYDRELPWSTKKRPAFRKAFSFMGVDSYTTKWKRQEPHGGLLVENIVQGMSADLLREALWVLDHDGFNPIMHVHDEVVCETGASRKDFDKIMSRVPSWAKGLPVEVVSYKARRYRKD